MEYLYIICSGLLVFFSISLIFKKQKALSELIFSAWIFLLLITVFSFFLYAKGLSGAYPVFITLICDSHLLHGAGMFIYMRAFTSPSFKLKTVHLWHSAPMIVQIVAKLYLNYVVGEMECYQEGGCVEEDNIFVTLTYMYKYAVLGFYIIITWSLVRKHKIKAVSPRDQMRHQWIKQIALGVSFLYLGILLIHLGRYFFPNLFWERMFLGNTLTTLFIFIFLYIGNSYTYIFVSPSRNRFKNLSEGFNTNNCQQKVNSNQMDEVLERLNRLMEDKKPFMSSNLTIKDLAEISGIPAVSISQTINSLTGQSVTDYINNYRVQLLKEKIIDPENANLTIMALAEDCGFGSKSTLVRIFKQFTGLTPSQYQKQQQG